ncbi:methionine-rich copper-binding protein CopC [Microbacterium resistens]|uniref:Methionine-rich copper-binding protein CopC n=1 Tax=Microbacterium resistens TaxID=156977 RepID=A0ABU1SAP7_9MICO|nr:copper resistance protein CopC [Microbacterium resistens]MDR6866690.1 methionine-rich copper-binding protein CopC [Microbacterium resistens]
MDHTVSPLHPTAADRATAPRARRRGRLRAALAGIAAGVLVVLGTAVPASAHDTLLSSTPAEGAVLDTAPTEIVLTFSGNILPGTAIVTVTDAAGVDYHQGDAVVSETTVTVGVKAGLANGAYEIRWAVTSEDGHPISRITPFSIAGAAAAGPSAAPTPAPTSPATGAPSADPATAAPSDAGAKTPTTAPTSAPQEGSSTGPMLALVLSGVAVLALVAVIVVILLRRRGHATGAAGADGAGSDASGPDATGQDSTGRS